MFSCLDEGEDDCRTDSEHALAGDVPVVLCPVGFPNWLKRVGAVDHRNFSFDNDGLLGVFGGDGAPGVSVGVSRLP